MILGPISGLVCTTGTETVMTTEAETVAVHDIKSSEKESKKESTSPGAASTMTTRGNQGNRWRWPSVQSMLGQRRRRWPIIKSILGEHHSFDGKATKLLLLLGSAVGRSPLSVFCLSLCPIYGKERWCVWATVHISVHHPYENVQYNVSGP